jgi:hypothetical protein
MTITLTHPTDPSIKWISGKKGKRPNWVNDILAKDPTLLPIKEKETSYTPEEDTTPRLRYWRWNGLNDEDGKGIPLTLCIVGGMTVQDAMTRLNKTFTTPVMPAEWATCWVEIDPANVALNGKLGVFEKQKGTTDWVERKEKSYGSKV